VAAREAGGRTVVRFSWLEVERLVDQLHTPSRLTAVGLEPALIRTGAVSRQTLAEVVSRDYAELMGLRVQAGRALLAADHAPGAAAVAIISDRLWRDLFQRAPSALQSTLVVNGRPFAVIGVAATSPPTTFLGASVDLWVPLVHGDVFFGADWQAAPDRRSLQVYLLPDVVPDATTAMLQRTGKTLARELPDPWRRRELQLLPGTVMLGAQQDTARLLFRVLQVLALLIVFVAGANAAGLLLAQAAAERRHTTIELALGAGPAAAPRRVLAQGGLLGTAAGVVATGLYAWARVRAAEIAILPTLSLRLDLPPVSDIAGWSVGAGLAGGLALAVGPAAWLHRSTTVGSVAHLARGGSERTLGRLRRLLIGAEVAAAIVLVCGTLAFGRSLTRIAEADLGIVRDGLLAFDFDIEPGQPDAPAAAALAADALRRARALPGVTAAAMSNRAPVDTSTPTMRVAARGDVSTTEGMEVSFNTVTDDFFQTVGTPILRGRALVPTDRDAVVVNAALADRLWAGDALGKALFLLADRRAVQVVGIARDAQYRTLGESGQAHIYLPTAPRFGLALLIRTADDPRRMLPAVQAMLDEVGPGIAGFFPRTHHDHLAIQVLPTRIAAATSTWFGAFALALAAVGIYGLVAWFVTVRRTELAVRLALGASRQDIAWLVIRQALAAAAPGLLAGVAVATAGLAAAGPLLYGGGGPDGRILVAAATALLSLVLLASWAPARRAASTNPAAMLRTW
jgi:predicted permease